MTKESKNVFFDSFLVQMGNIVETLSAMSLFYTSQVFCRYKVGAR